MKEMDEICLSQVEGDLLFILNLNHVCSIISLEALAAPFWKNNTLNQNWQSQLQQRYIFLPPSKMEIFSQLSNVLWEQITS